ncbi:monocarboxylate transporter 9-like isoform X2 [Ornithodoros turicata]|uniref:monocarboxylate transporter 9-like isoform X2 n=1 Tax=Ornithodoros turicata TaxID=34597 RepID=UPI00313982BE
MEDSPSQASRDLSVSLSDVRRPPDGGYGWVVVLASFAVNLIADGVSMSFGILFVDLVDYFGQGKGKTAWVGSLFFSMPLLTGPIASSLTDRYGCRRVCIVGALLATGGFVASFFTNSLEFLFLTFSVAGFGLALCYVTSIVIVAYYFEKRRSLATGLAVCGTGIGTFVFAPLTIRLLDAFAWRGTLLLLAGFFLNLVIFGALMRDLDLEADVHPIAEGQQRRLCSSLVQLPTYLSDKAPLDVLSENSRKEGGHLNSLLEQYPNIWNRIVPAESRGSTGEVRARGSEVLWGERRLQQRSDSACLRNMRLQRGSLTYRGAMLNVRRYRLKASSCPDIYRNSMLTITGEDRMCQMLSELREVLLDSLDVSLLKNVRYALLCFSNFLLSACVDNPYVYIPDSAIILGVDKERASFLISCIGILNTVGVVIVGYLGDKSWTEPSLLYGILTVVSGAAVGVLPLLHSYGALAMLSALYGFTISANYTLVPVILVDIISLDNFTGAYGLLLLVQGLAGLMGPPIAGWLCDTTGAYDATFYFSGFCIFASGIVMLPIAWKCQMPQVQESPPGSTKRTTVVLLPLEGNARDVSSCQMEGLIHDGPLSRCLKKVTYCWH